ncbi:hypothetical protein ACHAC9_23290 [Massilia sp. CMS3.1]|uniref:hypothetical protein n=1 Tax=Massilia sp. CMS3.1 TaxID=3373083 RepID=UPI003EE81CA0
MLNPASATGGDLPVEVMADPALFHARSGYGFFTLAKSHAAAPGATTGTAPGKTRKRPWQEWHYHARLAEKIQGSTVGSVDTYISQSSFRQFKDGRKIRNLSRVGAL